MSAVPPPPQVAPDGKFYFDGTHWVPMPPNVLAQEPRVRSSRSFTRFVEFGSTAIGIIALLLPLEGVVIRWESFSAASTSPVGFDAPMASLVVAANVPELAATGFAGIIGPAILYLGALWVSLVAAANWAHISALQRRLLGDADYSRWRSKTRRRWAVAIGLLMIGFPIALSFTEPDWWFGTSWFTESFAVDFGVITIALLQMEELTSFGFGVVLVVLATAILAVFAGYTGNPADVEPYIFHFRVQSQTQTSTNLPDGRYILLGGADGETYLQSCSDRSLHVISGMGVVDAQPLKRSPSPIQPSVLDLLRGRWTPVVGYRPDC